MCNQALFLMSDTRDGLFSDAPTDPLISVSLAV